jgi:hypothetical protein
LDDFRPKIGHSDCLTSSKLRRSWRLNRVAWLMWFFSCVIRSERTTPFLCEKKYFEDIKWLLTILPVHIPSWLFLLPCVNFSQDFQRNNNGYRVNIYPQGIFQMVWESESVQSVNKYTVQSYLKILSTYMTRKWWKCNNSWLSKKQTKSNPRNYWVKLLELVTVQFKLTKP